MNFTEILIIAFTGLAAGFINVNAGGGSLLTIPMLIFTGLPAVTANGTNRIALAAANIIAVLNFKNKGYFDWKLALFLAAPATAGAILGSFISISLSEETYNTILAVVIILVILIIIVNPQRFIKKNIIKSSLKHRVLSVVIFFALGVYGGVIQAGVGFLLITSLVFLTGYSLVRINSIKVFIVFIYMTFSIMVFIVSGNVNWMYALILSIGSSLGSYFGSLFAVKHGDKWIKLVLVSAAFIMALKLLNVF